MKEPPKKTLCSSRLPHALWVSATRKLSLAHLITWRPAVLGQREAEEEIRWKRENKTGWRGQRRKEIKREKQLLKIFFFPFCLHAHVHILKHLGERNNWRTVEYLGSLWPTAEGANMELCAASFGKGVQGQPRFFRREAASPVPSHIVGLCQFLSNCTRFGFQ